MPTHGLNLHLAALSMGKVSQPTNSTVLPSMGSKLDWRCLITKPICSIRFELHSFELKALLLTISNLKLCFFAFYDCFIIVWWNVSRTTCYLFDAAVLYKNLFAALNFTFYDFLVDLFSPNLVELLSNHLRRVHISLHWRFIEVKLTRPFFNPKVKRHTSIHKTVRSQ